MPDQRPSIVPGKGGNQFRDTSGMPGLTEILKRFGVPGRKYLMQLGSKHRQKNAHLTAKTA